MAYKFQLGAFTASGSIKAEDGFDAADQNITNVGDIALDSLSADGSSISISDDSLVATNKKIQFRDTDIYVNSDSDGELNLRSDSDITLTIDSTNVLGIDSSGAAITGTVVGTSHFSGSGDGRFAALDINSTADVISSALVASFASMKVDDGSTVGCDSDADVLTLNSQAATFANDVDVNVAKAGGLQIAGTAVTATAAELNALDGIQDAAYDESADSVVFFDATDSKIKHDAANDFATRLANNGLTAASGRISVTAAQTTITSLLATDIKIGEDDQTKIDFEDANKINFYANNAKELVLEENKLTPGANDGIALGDSSLGFSDLYLADGGAIEFGNDQDSKIAWSAADSLNIESAQDDFVLQLLNTNAGANGATFRIQASSSSPADNDKIGAIDFMGYDDGGGAHQFGIIEVTAVDVSAGAEQGKMELKVAENDGAATAGITLEGQTSDGVVNVTIGAGAASTTTIAGNLTVNGTTTTVNSTTVNVTSSLTFEGPADAHETTLHAGGDGTGASPQADTTIYMPAMSAGNYYMPVLAAASTTAISSTPAELNLLDGSAKSTSSITLADADGFIVIDGTTTKQIPASDIKTYIGNTSNLDVALKDNTETLAVGVNYFADLGGAEAVNLPASPTVGDAVYIKAPSNCNSTNTLTVNRQGSHTIDGETAIVLESPHAAVMCVYVVANTWKVF